MLESVLDVLMILGLLVALAIAIWLFVVVYFWVGVFCFFTGWIPILYVLDNPTLSFTLSGSNIMEKWGMLSIITYGIIFGGWAVITIWVFLFKPKGDDLPNWLKGIAWLFPHPAVDAVHQGTQRNIYQGVHGKELSRSLRVEPSNALSQKIRVHQAGKLEKQLSHEREWLEAQEKVAKEAIETERARGRVQGYHDEDADQSVLQSGEMDRNRIRMYAASTKK